MAAPNSKLAQYVIKNGRTPPVALNITPIETTRAPIRVTQFLHYSFSSSILQAVDAFSFTFSMPQVTGGIDQFIREGDIAELSCGDDTNGPIVCTGIVDVVDVETSPEGGDVVQIHGRNLAGQLEDQSAVSGIDEPLWATSASVQSAVAQVIRNTRIRGLITQSTPVGNFLFMTEPGETKLSALQRFAEPLNCVLFMSPDGYLVFGRPNMGQDSAGDLIMDRDSRNANVMSMKATRSSTQIPNVVIPIWSGQEIVTNRVGKQQRINNPAEGPARLLSLNHNVQKIVMISTPQGGDAQSLSDVNKITVGGQNIIQAYALREIARENIKELIVQATVKGHYNDQLAPFLIDSVYNVRYSRAGVSEKMYLYDVNWTNDARNGPITTLTLCRLGRIVAGIDLKAPAQIKILAGNMIR